MHSFLQGRHALNIFEGARVGGGGGGGGGGHFIVISYTMKWISYSQIHKNTFALWENSPERGIQSASEWRKHRHFSNDSSERLWLVLAFLSSTESCVIGYN